MNIVYRILNVATDEFYIGSTKNHRRRKWEHWDSLKKKTHHCAALQSAWNTYGPDAFEFEVLEEAPDTADLLLVEDKYLQQHAGQAHCYNTALTTLQPPSNTPATIEKIRETMQRKFAAAPSAHPRVGTRHTEETKAKISASRKGKGAGAEHYRFGQTLSVEVREKIGAAQRGVKKGPRVYTPEGRAKILAAAAAGRYASFAGKQHTEEAKAKMGKPIIEILSNSFFPTLTAALRKFGLQMPTLRRALKTGKPLSRGPHTGLWFKYLSRQAAETWNFSNRPGV